MTAFDFFEAAELPVPEVSAERAGQIAAAQFGLAAQAVALGSQQDANFLLTDDRTGPVGVLKIANPAFSRLELEAQDVAAAFIAAAEAIRTATNVGPAGAAAIAEVADRHRDGGRLFARVIRYLSGGTLSGQAYLSPAQVAALGDLAGRTCRALAGFEHPGVDRVLQWDLRHGMRTVELLAAHVGDADRRAAVESAADAAWDTLAGLAEDLPIQVIHGDITGDNVVRGADGLPDGLIDFGDLMRSWAVAELAVTVATLLRHEGSEPATTLPAIRAFHAVRPLAPAEAEALWPLVVLRAAVLVVSGNHQSAVDAENHYASSALDAEWRIFEQASAIPLGVMTAQIRHALGMAVPAEHLTGDAPLIRGVDPRQIIRLDFSAESGAMDGGAWLNPDAEDQLARVALAGGAAAAAVTTFGEARLTRSATLNPDSPATVATGVHLWPATAVDLTAPWPGRVETTCQSVTLTGAGGTVQVLGAVQPVETDPSVTAGGQLGVIDGPVWIQVRRHGTSTPQFVRPEYAAGWLDQVSDPLVLLGLPHTPDLVEEGESLRQRRSRAFATVQEHYYDDPPRIERGWREHLIGTDGRTYLDMVNNVAVLGHGHPELADAVARQWRRLNTNSRFNYASVVAFSERLAATLPDPLDTVFLVNSGSEADDLALRLAMAATGRHDVVAVAEAYHGWTYATDAISTSIADNPNALSTRPPWVHTVPSPNAYRGEHRGPEASKYAPEAVAIIERLAAQGHPPAAFICEPFYGNAGGMALPDGYLRAVYAAVRGVGGLAIADEVQVGYGRTGRWFWAFEQQGVVPDIVCVAKAMGNGQPLGAVITTKAIADAYRNCGYFFSSAGGSPVSCIVGLTVLDIIERDHLQRNALDIGDHLKTRITALAEQYPIIGTVHGSGLYMGVELVTDRATLEPAAAQTAAICERMRELGVIVQPTGDRQNVLKMKPPMCITRESADYFVDMLERVLRTGW
jgi:4-aminobutyrate aminotransferase-like enzyme/Ser/Thr protein kinase RdoA (MazF antagonist)